MKSKQVEKKQSLVPPVLDSKIALVVSPYYLEITNNLIAGATKALLEFKVETKTIEVDGALEIPGAISIARESFNAFVALGCIIRGETSHYEIVSQNSAQGIMQLTLQGICIGNGIITVENFKQAHERSDLNDLDKGGDAARAAVGLMILKQEYTKI
tara:strand:+ start:72 stop:542 length:471 start_codon:yes stop_codon:yes gene_type:complete